MNYVNSFIISINNIKEMITNLKDKKSKSKRKYKKSDKHNIKIF